MDWASAEWKQALTPLAVQKVSALEEKIEKLQKDRQQKQLQFECLELALEKEKRKTEREKQYSTEIQRDLQSLADTCKDFENKQQKLQNELQNRDSRIKNLEALLLQSRKESSKLQQLESDLKDLSYVRENALTVREQKLQKRRQIFEQSITEQNSNTSMTKDSYDVTEQTSVNLIDTNDIEKSLKQKIEEQEELIKELRTQLDSVSRNDEINHSSNVFKTPGKSMSVTDSPAIDAKNAWNVFNSTPAKGNKNRMLGHGDSTSIDSGNEKVLALQSRLKQLSQELDCQRHNFEASKNSLELKYKESESTLKADLKYQIQANTELDKELKESKNKYQQELSQTTKKLDMLTLQLKKSEEAKAACERDLKSLESRINMNETTLKLKEEELCDLQKSKNACDSTQQSLQSKIRELEKNCRALTEENNSLTENVGATRMQLEGSNNLVKEKEISLHNAQQEMANLQLKIKELENNFAAQEARLKESKVNEALIAEQLEFLVQEKKELNDSLNSEMKRNQNAESSIEEQKQSILLLKEELNQKTLHTEELRNQMVILTNEYQVKLCELENKFQTAKQEHDTLQNETILTETSLKQTIRKLEESNKELSDSIAGEKDKHDSLKLNLEEATLKMLSLEEELTSKCLQIEELQNQINNLTHEFEVKLGEFENKYYTLKEEHDALQNESVSTEAMLKERIKQLEESNKELFDDIRAEKDRNDCVKENLEVATQKVLSIQEELTSKCLQIEELQNRMNISVNEFDVKLGEFENKYHTLKEEHDALQNESVSTEAMLKERIKQLEESNKELFDDISAEKDRNDCVKENLEVETRKVLSIQEELTSKCLQIEELQNRMNISVNEFEVKLGEFENKYYTLKEEHDALQNESVSTEAMLKERIKQLEESNKELFDDIRAEKDRNDCVKENLEVATQKVLSIQEELTSKYLQIEELQNRMNISVNEFEVNKHKLEQELCEVSSKEASLIAKLGHVEGLNKELSCNITVEKNKCDGLKLNLGEETLKIVSLKEELASKCMALEELQNEMKTSRNQLANEIKELNNALNTSQARIASLETELNAVSIDDGVKERLKLSEQEKLELSNQLKLKISAVKQLELCYKNEKDESSSLKEKLEMKCVEFEDLANSVEVLNEEHKAEIKELTSTLDSSQAQISSLESEINTFSSNINNLKEKLALVEEEKLELGNQINLKTTKVQQLELSIEKGKKDFLLLKESFENKCAELDELKCQVTVLKECESNNGEMKQKFHAAMEQLGKLQNQLRESSLMELSLKEQIAHLEESNKQLSDDLNAESNNAKCLQLNLHEESQKILLLNENLSSKSLELEELQSEMLCLKNQFESDIQALETELDAAISNANTTEKQLKSTEQEKSDLFEKLRLETTKCQEFKSCLEDEKQASCRLKEKIASYCVQLEELSNHWKNLSAKYEAKDHELQEKFSSVEAKSMLLENQFKEYSLNKILAEEKFDLAEKEKKELLNQLTSAATQIQKLELSIEEERKVSFMLEEEIAHNCLECQKLNDQIRNLNEVYEERVLELETRFSSAEAKCMMLENQFKEYSCNKIPANEEAELLGKLASSAIKIQEFEACIENEKQAYSLLKEDMENKCVEVKDLQSQMEILKEEHGIVMHELEEKLHVANQELSASQKQLQESSLMEASLKEQIEQLESSNNEISNNLKTERDRNKCTQLHLQEASQEISTLKEELSSNSLEIKELTNQMLISKSQFENQIKALEVENNYKEKLDLVKQENSELCLQLKLEAAKIQQLESSIQAEKETCLLLEEKLGNKCLEFDNLNRQIKDLEKTLLDTKHKLSCLEVEKVSLEQEKDGIAKELKSETDKCQSLGLSLNRWGAFVISLDESLFHVACKEQTLAKERNDSKKYYEDKIEKLENELTLAQLAYTTLKSDRGDSTFNEMELKQQLDILVKEKANLTSEVEEATNKYLQFEMTIQEQQIKMQEQEEKLSHFETQSATLELKLKESCQIEVSLKEELWQGQNDRVEQGWRTFMDQRAIFSKEMVNEAIDVPSNNFDLNKIEKLENELALAHIAYATLKSERGESTSNEMELKQQLDILVKEKENLTTEVEEATNKYLQFEMTILEQRIKMQELEEKLSHFETQSATFELKLKESCQIEVSLREELSQGQNECVKLAELLSEKTDEVKTLNTCIESIREDLTSMEEKLSLKADKLKELHNKEEAIKDYENQIQDLEYRLLAAQDQQKDFENQLLANASNEESLTTSLAMLEKEHSKVSEKLNSEYEKTEELMLVMQELTDSRESLEEELSRKTLLLGEANTLENEFRNIIKDLEADFQNQLQEYSMNEKNLKSSLTVLEKDNEEISEKLTAEYLKTEKLELCVEELETAITASTKQLEDHTKLSNNLQRTIQNLQDGMRDVQAENVILGNEVKGYLLNEQLLKKGLDSVEKEKHVIYNQLSVEASKVRILETGIGELKRMIMALQVMLLCNNDDTNWAYSKKSTSKDLYKDLNCGGNGQSPEKFILKSATPKKSRLSLDLAPIRYSAVASKTVDFNEMSMAQSYKELEFSEALHKFSLRFLKEIHSLEEDLIAKIEFLKFVYSYKLFEKKELSCLWKKFCFLTKQLQMIQIVKKFMSCVCNILKSNVISCKFDNSRTELPGLMSEKPYLSTQDIFYLCGDTLNKVLFSVSQTLQQSKIDIKQCCVDKYSTVQSNMLSVNLSTKFLIYLHHLSRSFINSELGLFKQNPCVKRDVQNAQKILSVLKVQDLPYFMNYVVALTAYIEKICCGTNTVLQLHSPKNLPISLSLPHIFKQYHLNCLDTDNDKILDELKYWRKYCCILGISEWDIEKIIQLFECKTKNITPSKTTKDLSVEINSLNEECRALQNAILAEKDKQLLLNATIEEIEQDLRETFQQKEKYMKMALETSTVLLKLKEGIEHNGFHFMELENDLSGDSCYCEMCILQEESEINSPHEKLSLPDLFACIKKLAVEFRKEVETKLLKFSQQADLTTMYKELQDKNSELEMALASLNVGSKNTRDEIENLRYELLKEKENYQLICQTVDQKDSLILELESTALNLSAANEKYKVKLGDFEEKIFKLSAELEELSDVLSSKEKEVDFLQKAMEEEELMFQNVQLQCKEYENKIQLLNSTVSKFEEEKALDQHLNSFSGSKNQNTISELQDKICNNQNTISELQDKIESLKKANDSLNLTIETIEEELRTVYAEKKNVEQLEKLTMQNIQLKDEATNATQKYVCEQQANKVLLSDLRKLEILKTSSDDIINDLKRKNDILDKDVNLLKNVLRDHEQVILKNNSSLELKDQVIDRLKNEISETELKYIDLIAELEENIDFLTFRRSELSERCCILEKENNDLHVQTKILLQDVDEVKLQRDSLLKDTNALRRELEEAREQILHHETTHKELVLKYKETCDVLNKEITLKNSLEEELANSKNATNDLDNQLQKLKTTTEEFKLLNSKQEEENMVLVQKVKYLEKEIQEAKNSLTESFQKRLESLLMENKELFEKLRESESSAVSRTSSFHNLNSAFTNAIQFVINILDITINSIKSDSSYPEAQKLKSRLQSALQDWEQCSEAESKTEDTFNEIFDNLRYFYRTLTNKCGEERAICGQIELIGYTLKSIGQFCDSSAKKYQASNNANITNMTMFETTIVESSSDSAQVYYSPSVLATELQNIKSLLDEYFSSMRNIINKQEEEIAIFKTKLSEMSVKQVSSGAESIEADKSSYKWKYNLIKMNNQKLEKDYNKLGKAYHEMEERIKILEKEKQSLEEEAEELAADFKKIEDQLYNSNELAEAYKTLGHAQLKLKESENENNWLKQKLEYCRANHAKKTILASTEGASNVLATAEYKENVKNGNDKFIS